MDRHTGNRIGETCAECGGSMLHDKECPYLARGPASSAEVAALKARLEAAEGLLKRWDDLTVVVTPMPDLRRDTRAFLDAGKGDG